jgi:hypothetical protein
LKGKDYVIIREFIRIIQKNFAFPNSFISTRFPKSVLSCILKKRTFSSHKIIYGKCAENIKRDKKENATNNPIILQ